MYYYTHLWLYERFTRLVKLLHRKKVEIQIVKVSLMCCFYINTCSLSLLQRLVHYLIALLLLIFTWSLMALVYRPPPAQHKKLENQ